MGGFTYEVKGDYKKTTSWLSRLNRNKLSQELERYGQAGVSALSSATPTRTGLTAASWGYEVSSNASVSRITWTNSNVRNGVPIAIILQYGHGTGTGGWVEGRDYINPAIKPVMDQISDGVWKAVTRG